MENHPSGRLEFWRSGGSGSLLILIQKYPFGRVQFWGSDACGSLRSLIRNVSIWASKAQEFRRVRFFYTFHKEGIRLDVWSSEFQAGLFYLQFQSGKHPFGRLELRSSDASGSLFMLIKKYSFGRLEFWSSVASDTLIIFIKKNMHLNVRSSQVQTLP